MASVGYTLFTSILEELKLPDGWTADTNEKPQAARLTVSRPLIHGSGLKVKQNPILTLHCRIDSSVVSVCYPVNTLIDLVDLTEPGSVELIKEHTAFCIHVASEVSDLEYIRDPSGVTRPPRTMKR